MVIASWIVFGLLALLWTGAAFAAAAFAGWAAEALASGAAARAGRELAQVPLPEWLALWLDPAWVRAIQGMLLWALDALQGSLPFLGSVAGWLQPLVWLAWGAGLLALLAAAGGMHLLLRRVGQPRLARG